MNESSPYGRQKIRRSFMHFLLGKGISSIAGIAFLLLTVRYLSVEEFATYSLLLALVPILSTLSGVGLTHILMRYTPELHALHKNDVLANLVYRMLLIRSFVLFILLLAIYIFAAQVSAWFGLNEWVPVFQAYLLVVALRVTADSCVQILESMLRQGLSQFASTLTTLSKLSLVLMVFGVLGNVISLDRLITIEAIAEGLGLTFLLVGIVRTLSQLTKLKPPDGGENWIRDNFSRMAKFGSAGYVQHVALTLYGGPANRLLAGRLFDAPMVAAYGFAQSIVDLADRYLPGKFLLGMIRPVMLARYASTRDFDALSKSINLVFKIDFSVLGAAIVLLGVAGDPISSLLSGGKYQGMAGNLILALLIVVIFEALISLIWISVEALERNRIMLIANLILSASLFLAWPLASFIGPFAMAAANLIGILVSIGLLMIYLRRLGYRLLLDWGAFSRYSFALLIALSLGHGLLNIGVVWWASAATAVLFYTALLLISKILSDAEIKSLRGLARR